MLTNEQREIQALARDVAESELRPHAAAWDDRRALDESVFGKLADLGFLGMLIPEEFGGLGFDLTTYLVVLEELARGDASVARAVAMHNGPVATLLTDHGTEEQKARWLAELAVGRVLGTFAFPGSGTEGDFDSTRVRAEPRDRGKGWKLEGLAGWVTNGARAGLVVLVARTAMNELAVFLVPLPIDGYAAGEPSKTLGLRAAEIVPVKLSGVSLSGDALLGGTRGATEQTIEALDVARLGTAAQALGVGRAAMEHAAEYALGREQFGEPIARFGAIQEKLAGMAERLAGARALALDAAAALQAGRNGAGNARHGLDGTTARAAMAKLAASEAATWAADEAVQVFGGYGYMKHYPVEKLLRDAKGAEIDMGTNEILRNVIALELLRDRGEAMKSRAR